MNIRQRLIDALFGALGGILVGLIGYAVLFGEMRSDIKSLKGDVKTLQETTREGVSPKIRKGDLCLKMFETLATEMGTYTSTRVDEVKEQLEKLDCYDGVQPMLVDELDELPPELREQYEK